MQGLNKSRWFGSGCAIISLASGSAAAAAAEPPAATAPATAPAAEPQASATPASPQGEIIVTAQKRSQSIGNVGMAITAATGAQLRAQGISDVAGLVKIDPSLVVSQTLYGTPVYTIRGIGYNDFSLASSPTVSIYTDELPYPYAPMSKAAALDVERVEILKGPQGTLFGQNATGGAINYIAAKPTSHFAAGFGASYGRFDATTLDGFVSGPLNDTLRARVAFDVSQGGAWQRSFTRPDDELGDKDQARIRGILDWRPASNLRLSLTLTAWKDRSDTQAGQAIGLAPQNTGTYPRFPFADPTLAGRTFANIVGLVLPGIPTNSRQADWEAGLRPRNDQRSYQAGLRAEYDLSGNATLTYLGGYQDYRQNDILSFQGLPTRYKITSFGRVKFLYQEARLGGKALGNKIDWIAGASYSRAKTSENQTTDFLGTNSFATIALPFVVLHQPRLLDPFNIVANLSTDTNKSYAAFGNLEYHFLDNLSVQGGIRYTKTTVDHVGCAADGDGKLAAGIALLYQLRGVGNGTFPQAGQCVTLLPDHTTGFFRDSLKEHNVSWRVGLNWHPIDRTLVYASVSKGYKSGNYPTLAASSFVQLLPVRQESVLAYELGVKSRLAGGHLQLDGAIFFYKYDDKQVQGTVVDPLGVFGSLQALVNVPKSEEKGAELSIRYEPVDGLTLSGSGSYIHSEVTGHFLSVDPWSSTAPAGQPPNNVIDLKGEPFPNTPKWSARGSAQYEWGVFGDKRAFIGGEVAYTSKAQGQFGNQHGIARNFPSLTLKEYTTLDLQAGLKAADDRWSIRVWGRNVTNTYYWTQALHTFDTAVRFAGRPATYGVTGDVRF